MVRAGDAVEDEVPNEAEEAALAEMIAAIADGSITPDAALQQLRRLPFADTGDALVDSCLRTMHAVPGPRGGTLLPANVGELREAAAFFNFGKSDVAGSQQHIFDVSLWDDSLEVLAEAVVEEDGALLDEAAAAIGAPTGSRAIGVPPPCAALGVPPRVCSIRRAPQGVQHMAGPTK